ncbi:MULTISPECIES: lysine exporter LysO family protein [Metallosphaera]|uniref:lysine exporter LysO family protein n=1 Tax=Metallosphaera TaxID=41980 RepID=UPI001F05E0D2|nr:lysine exporter LysO family protein [Metallosphaera sedula]MCH1771716.1 lysine exporter LysO family protein [Metallosphaera sedula]MCP6728315.1 lysine exporter LysO family protein [Metallosphaera sedula]
MLIYVVALGLGKVLRKSFPKLGDAVVLVLIFSIALWGGSQVISGSILSGIVLDSVILSVFVVLITFAVGLTFNKKVNVKGKISLVYTQLKYGAPLVLGLSVGFLVKPSLDYSQIIVYELYILALVIGFNIGSEIKFRAILHVTREALVTTLVVIIGAVVCALASFGLGLLPNLKLALVMFLGAGWYSYTGPIVSTYYGPVYGVIAFLTNFFREQLAFLVVPVLVKARPNPYSAIAIGGATSMDTTLGLYSSIFTGEYSVSAMMSGALLTLIIPVMLPLVLAL